MEFVAKLVNAGKFDSNGNFALRFKPVDIQFSKPDWNNIMTKRDKPAMSEEEFKTAIKELAQNDELARLKKEYGENAKGTVSYQQIQSDLVAGTKAIPSGNSLDIQI